MLCCNTCLTADAQLLLLLSHNNNNRLHMEYNNSGNDNDKECIYEAYEALKGTETASCKQENVAENILCAVPQTSRLVLVLTSCL